MEKKHKVFKIGYDGSYCLVLEEDDILSIIKHEIIENHPFEIGDDLSITISVIEMTDKEIEDAGEFDGF